MRDGVRAAWREASPLLSIRLRQRERRSPVVIKLYVTTPPPSASPLFPLRFRVSQMVKLMVWNTSLLCVSLPVSLYRLPRRRCACGGLATQGARARTNQQSLRAAGAGNRLRLSTAPPPSERRAIASVAPKPASAIFEHAARPATGASFPTHESIGDSTITRFALTPRI